MQWIQNDNAVFAMGLIAHKRSRIAYVHNWATERYRVLITTENQKSHKFINIIILHNCFYELLLPCKCIAYKGDFLEPEAIWRKYQLINCSFLSYNHWSGKVWSIDAARRCSADVNVCFFRSSAIAYMQIIVFPRILYACLILSSSS